MNKNILYLYIAPDRSSLNKAIKEIVFKAFQNLGIKSIKFLNIFDLDLTSFSDPSLKEKIGLSQEYVKWADIIIAQFPVWWYSIPGIFKIWFELVMVVDFAYKTVKPNAGMGLLQGKEVIFIGTVGSKKNDIVNNYTIPNIEALIHPWVLAFNYAAIENKRNLFFYGCNLLSKEEFEQIATDTNKFIMDNFSSK
ncbi:NAD(P)H-dependent oxidoreductase [Mycoplasma sp. SG1]|uniref:NAD(P)H-dependent oxidoreductase n=1 Tax=Mycoplasma sp. SG1 TaxID=2810348 RepID=UPI0020242969|nr:NAD(P)H-dependent oxidoreductase [Mycoplasma sp. SG1]URM53082.1 NAD(P)H-dependent oxidoreductase [Mycoplasma sp. SG1]